MCPSEAALSSVKKSCTRVASKVGSSWAIGGLNDGREQAFRRSSS